MTPTILITRPDPYAAEFADQLRARLGCEVSVVLSPLLQIEPCGELPDLKVTNTLIFTSRNGVTAFAAKTDRRDIPCFCVGAATAQSARVVGMDAVSCDGASDELVAQIAATGTVGPCLHIRGEHGIGDVVVRLQAEGILADQVVLYRQIPRLLSEEAVALLHGDTRLILPLFSPRTARLLFAIGGISAKFDVVAMSNNVAAELPKCSADKVVVAENPTVLGMLDAVERLVATANSLETGNLAQ